MIQWMLICSRPSRGEHSAAVPLKEINNYILSTMDQTKQNPKKSNTTTWVVVQHGGGEFFFSLVVSSVFSHIDLGLKVLKIYRCDLAK